MQLTMPQKSRSCASATEAMFRFFINSLLLAKANENANKDPRGPVRMLVWMLATLEGEVAQD